MRDRDDREPDELFGSLRDRPTPDLDTEGAWRQLQARLETRRIVQADGAGPLAWLRALTAAPARVALATAAIGAVAVAAWLALPVGMHPATESAAETAPLARDAAGEADLVLLADAESAGTTEAAPEVPTSYELEVRLVRGFDGSPPDNAIPRPAAGAGGADPLADLIPTLRAVVPTEDYALVGSWQGAVRPGSAEASIGNRFDLLYRVERTDRGVRLLDVQLAGESGPRIADEIALEPGRVYVFGAGAGSPEDLVLAIRLRPVDAADASTPREE